MREDAREFRHESYGMVGFSRITGSSGRMFGSSLPNQGTFVRLRLTRATRRHELGRDWYHGETQTMYEVDLSSAQFAELLTSMNVGSGVPCTIRHAEGRRMEDPPDELLEAEQVRTDFKGKTEAVAKRLDGMKARIDEILAKKSVTVADRKEVADLTMMIVQEVRSNLPFWLSQFNEATQKITSAAKAEVDAFMTAAVMTAGWKALQGAEAQMPPELPPREKEG